MAWINTKGSKPKTHAPRQGWTYNKYKKVYNSQLWKDKRRGVLYSQPLCVMCEEQGIETFANEVDHIIPLSQGGDPYNNSNLQPLCTSHHQKKTGMESWIGKQK